MEYRLEVDQEITITVKAIEPYSSSYVAVKENETYDFKVDPNDKWTDWFIRTNANGFWNILLRNKMKRVPDYRCFKLCGTIERNEEGHFAIGTSKEWTSSKEGFLYFFANDSKKLNRQGKFKYYNNNKGCIGLKIKRLS